MDRETFLDLAIARIYRSGKLLEEAIDYMESNDMLGENDDTLKKML